MDVRVAGEVFYENYATDSRVIEKVQSLTVDKFGYDWTWLQIDDCILFEILGVGVVGQGNILRATKDYLPATRTTLNNLPRVNVKKDGRCPVLLDAIKRMKDRYGESLAVCHDTINGRCALMGNVDPIGQLMNGTPESVSAQVEGILRNVSVKGGHLIDSGEMVPRDTPEENMTAFGETVRQIWPEICD